jgi:hypothetical protein
MTMTFFSLAGGEIGVPVALQIVPAGNVPELLLDAVDALDELLLDAVDALLDELAELLLDELAELLLDAPDEADELLLPLVLDELAEVLVLPLDELLPPVPPPPLEPPPQATRDCTKSGIATRHALMAMEGAFMETFFPVGVRGAP